MEATTSTTTDTMATTTSNLAFRKLLAGISAPELPVEATKSNEEPPASVTTTLFERATTTTEDPEVMRDREQQAMLQKEVVIKLTAGMEKLTSEDESEAT